MRTIPIGLQLTIQRVSLRFSVCKYSVPTLDFLKEINIVNSSLEDIHNLHLSAQQFACNTHWTIKNADKLCPLQHFTFPPPSANISLSSSTMQSHLSSVSSTQVPRHYMTSFRPYLFSTRSPSFQLMCLAHRLIAYAIRTRKTALMIRLVSLLLSPKAIVKRVTYTVSPNRPSFLLHLNSFITVFRRSFHVKSSASERITTNTTDSCLILGEYDATILVFMTVFKNMTSMERH